MFRSCLYLVVVAILMMATPFSAPAQQRGRKSSAKTTAAVSSRSAAKAKGKKAPVRETADEARRREAEAQQDIAATRRQIRENDAQVRRGLSELGRLRTDIDAGEKLVAQASQQVKTLEQQIGGLETEIAASQTELERMRADYLRSLKKIRAHRNSTSDLAFIFSARDFSEAMQRMRYLRRFAQWRQQRAGKINGKVQTLAAQRSQLTSSRTERNRTLTRQLTAQNTLQKQYAQQDRVVTDLKRNGDALRTHLRQKQAEANALKGRIAAIIAAEQQRAEAAQRASEEAARKRELAQRQKEARSKAAEQRADKKSGAGQLQADNTSSASRRKKSGSSTSSSTTGSSSAATSTKSTAAAHRDADDVAEAAPRQEAPRRVDSDSGFGAMRGALPRPVAGAFKVTSHFGRNSYTGFSDVAYDNPGIDAQVPLGSAARAVYAGKVSGVYMLQGYNTVVIVNHGGYYTVYGNLSGPSVKVGDTVKQGDTIGRIAPDSDNPSSGSIHFEVWRNRAKLNPLDWLR